MKNNKLWTQCILSWLLGGFLVGCVSTKYVEHKQYLLESPKNLVKKHTSSFDSSIFVEHVSAEAPFDQLDFLYKVESGRYLVDYYNGFFVEPSEQLDRILLAYLKDYANFKVDVIGTQTTQDRLQVKLIELCADYRNRNNPQAVVALQFYLTAVIDGKEVVLLDKVFKAGIALKEKNTKSLLEAWNLGLQKVVIQGISMLNQTIKASK